MFLTSIFTSKNTMITEFLVFVAYISALLLALSMHEFAHAFAAKREGDNTASYLGRYTLAPFAHLDVVGIIFLVIFGFGWGKPVPIDSRNFRKGRKSEFCVYSAGIFANILIGVIFALIYTVLTMFFPQIFTALGSYGYALSYFLKYMISLNFIFAFFNLLPFYGFDGYRLIETFSKPNNRFLLFMQRYGFMLMILFVFTGLISVYINNVAIGLANLVLQGFGEFFGLFL